MYNDLSPQILTFAVIAIIVLFLIVVRVLFRDIKYLEKEEEAHDKRVRKLRFGKMLNYLGIPLKKYDHHTTDLEQELHIWHCQHCPNPDKCERLFKGENLDPKTFCPNYKELQKLRS